jgi:hypothetical protein
MAAAAGSKRSPPLGETLLRQVGSVLLWAAVAVLGLFGAYFSFANYPWYGGTVILGLLPLVAYLERKRRATQHSRDRARRQQRLGR